MQSEQDFPLQTIWTHTALDNHRQAKCHLLFWVRHYWVDLHLIFCTAQSLWMDRDFAAEIFPADVHTAWRLASVTGVATHTVPRADSDTLSSQSAPWTLSVAYFSRQKSKQRVGDPFLTWKEATGTSFSCSSGSPAFSERDLPWSRTNCDPLHVAGTTTLEWGPGRQRGSKTFIPSSRVRTRWTAWIQGLHSQLTSQKTYLLDSCPVFWQDYTEDQWYNEGQFDWRKKRPLDQVSKDKKCWSGPYECILLMMSLGTTPGKSPGKWPVESDWGLTSGEELIFQGLLDTETQIIRNY